MDNNTRTIPREVSQREIGYLAGILDGEGSLSFGKSKNKNTKLGFNLYNGISLVNTNLEMIHKCSDIIFRLCENIETDTRKTMSKVDIKNYNNDIVKFKNTPKQCYQITLRNKHWSIHLLKTLLPDLTEKKKKAIALIEILSHRVALTADARKIKKFAKYEMEHLENYFKLWDDARRD